MNNGINIKITDFRAIKEADIRVDGITVLTGLNATGKSTISRLLYFALYYSNNYNELPEEAKDGELFILNYYLRTTLQTKEEIAHAVTDLLKDEGIDDRFLFVSNFSSSLSDSIIEIIRAYYVSHVVSATDRERLGKAIKRPILNRREFFKGLDEIKLMIGQVWDRYYSNIDARPRSFFDNKLKSYFGLSTYTDDLSQHFNVTESGQTVISSTKKNIGFFTSVSNAFYIDTPVVVDLQKEYFRNSLSDLHWKQLLKIFDTPGVLPSNAETEEALKAISDIVQGTIVTPDNKTGVWRSKTIEFSDSYGRNYPLSEAATGIKSFAILLRLLQLNLLNEESLIIIDEPEAHLHPQWVSRYANVIAYLNQKLGVRFLLASHSPHMVQALYFALKQANETDTAPLRYYLAKEADSLSGQYVFEDLGTNIDPIFEVYNTSYNYYKGYNDEGEE